MRKILIVEDDQAIAELEKDYLEVNDYIVQVVTDGDQGLKTALEESFDLILLDIMLPGKNGFEICQQVRAKKDIPIIIVSAKKDDIDKIKGLGLGANDYITKPFSPGELVARIKAHLQMYDRLMSLHEKQNDVIEIRGLKIDRSARRVSVDGEVKSLTVKEFDVLEFLALHPDGVYSKEEIFQAVWPTEATGDASTITVHMNKIREKIEQNPAKGQYIETVWGAGYRFRV